MKLKKAILAVMDRDTLKAVADDLDTRINQKDVDLSKPNSLAALTASIQKRVPSILNPGD